MNNNFFIDILAISYKNGLFNKALVPNMPQSNIYATGKYKKTKKKQHFCCFFFIF
tara:strand:+ start:1195 stop:1359 length:165 start_codon:yes stop_codon:yes gene_type:complete